MYLEQPFWNSGFVWMFSCPSSRLFTGLMILSVLSMWPDTSWQMPSSHRLTSLNFYFLVIYRKDIPPFPNRPAKGFEGFWGEDPQLFPLTQLVKNPPGMWETCLGWDDPLEKGKATHSSILAWGIPRNVWFMGSQRVGRD